MAALRTAACDSLDKEPDLFEPIWDRQDSKATHCTSLTNYVKIDAWQTCLGRSAGNTRAHQTFQPESCDRTAWTGDGAGWQRIYYGLAPLSQ